MNEGYVIYTHVVSAAKVIYLFLENLLLQQCLNVAVGSVQHLTVGARFVVRLTPHPIRSCLITLWAGFTILLRIMELSPIV